MRESRVWAYLDGHMPGHLEVERVEVKHPPGLADCWWHDKVLGVSGWLELKYCELGDRELAAGRIPKLRPEQPLWLNRKARAGVPAGILLRCGESLWALWLATGDPAWANGVRSTLAVAMIDYRWDTRRAPLPVGEVFARMVDWRTDWRKRHGLVL